KQWLEKVHQEVVVQQTPSQITYGGRPSSASPPIFEQIFRNARFAQGGNALFEGKVRGNPKPVVSWTRKGAALIESNKYKMTYDENTGNVTLQINHIGPGDEGEYTCTARAGQLVQQGGYQKEFAQTYETSEQRISGTQTQSSFQRFQQTSGKVSYANGHTVEEDFKVDTFEYRLLREVEFRESLTRRYANETDAQILTTVDRSLGPVAPPQIAQKPRNSKLSEGADATFQARVSANPKPRLTWFKNGQRIVQSQKYQTTYSNQQAALKIVNARSEDSGHYTLLAENPQGWFLYTSQRTTQVESTTVVDSAADGKTLAPNFVRVCADRDASEGKMTRFDCRVTGRPYPEVYWFINGRQVSDDATHKVLVNESGNHALMITNVSRSDAGVISCIARNKSGETSFQCNLNVIEKEQVVAPKFVERFTTVHVKEGEPVVLNARAVGTPIPRITWQKDGVPIVPGPDVHIAIDSGASTLDIPRAKASDAAWYQCTAQNVAGSTATRARLFVETPKGSTPEPRRLNLPRPMKVIEPELAPGPEVIYLRHVERAKPHVPQGEEDRIYPPPVFIVPLSDVSQVEGGRVHFEARIEPVGDPTMRVDWFVNGRPLEASSRATTTFRFGFIALDLISIIIEDSGEYVCRVTSQSGSVDSQALLSVTARATIEQSSQYPDSLQYIQQLEDYSRYQRTESVEESSAQRPTFIRPLQDLGELQEGRNAHFEAQLTPVSDPTMKVEWYKDGKHITASSRITTIFNFGYVSLNIMHLRAEDAGTYTVRAVNHLGEAISSSTLRVFARTSVTGDLGIPEQQRYIEKVEELEAYQQQQQYKYVQELPESTSPPEFKTPIKDQPNIREGGFAHFEARLEPIGDSTLQVEWLKDGRPVEASSRITTFFNFGYVALTIKHVTTHDIGVYTCRAFNRLGQATTSAQLTVVSKKDIILESQHPGGLEKIQYLEDSSRYDRSTREETTVTQKPRFMGPLKGTNKIVEGQRAHFEVRVEPQNDMSMQIEWYFNGRIIQTANRIQTYHDFGYVAIDILSVRAEDAGTYTVIARNALGEAQLSATMEVEGKSNLAFICLCNNTLMLLTVRSSIDTRSMHRSTMEKTQHLESKFVEPQYHIEEISKSKPIFVQPLSDPKPVNEGKNIHLECRLEPMGDPTMRVEWFYNGHPVTVGSRFRTYYDFGFVALDIIHATSLDSGEYTVRATNHLGSAHTSACVRVISRSDIVTDSHNEAALEQIQMLEDSSRYRRHVTDDVTIVQAPQFTRPLHNLETVEGTNVHLECRLQPVGDPSMRVDWFVNGRPVPTGHRFRPAYDFDYVALDLLGVYPVDSGVYTCQARNQLGEAVTSCSVRVVGSRISRTHDFGFVAMDMTHVRDEDDGVYMCRASNALGEAVTTASMKIKRLEKIQYLEDSSRYKKSEYIDEVVNIRPRFLTKPKSLDNMREGQHAHFECKLEPVTDTNLKVEWYKNGRPITVGHRFRPIHDFGYVALDIIDLIAEDSGTYTCRAVNLVGADETTCTLNCRSTAQIVTGTQNESGLEQIHYLEDRSRYQRSEFVEETTKQAPIFTSSLKHIDIKEGQRAHFECRLIPVSDPTMKVEWFHNNVPVKSGSRFTETNNFGFVALDILYCYPEDSGTYTCRAKNILGEAVTSANLAKSIYLETQHESALDRITYLEDSSRYQKQTMQEESVTQAPVFTQPMRDIKVAENQAVHFEARLIPVGDPKLKVEWLRNANRITTMHDFGYVALNMKYVYPEDSGTYTCRAINELGQAVTSSTLSQHEGALEKLSMLEDSSRYRRQEDEEIIVTQAPRFTSQLHGPTNLMEAQSAHYECRIEPYPDPNLKVEWYHNGTPLQTGHRFRTTYDFGFAALDILTVYAEDSGEYTCKATNNLGSATSSIKLNHEGALQKIQYLEDDSRYKRTKTEETVIAEKPQFGRPLRNVEHLPEGLSVHLEATLTPVNDPTMKVEWYCDGRPIPQAKASIQLETQHPEGMRKIQALEQRTPSRPDEPDRAFEKPVFTSLLTGPSELWEGQNAHFECRVVPVGDPSLRFEWFVNGIELKMGSRFHVTHDFGFVTLDINSTVTEDSGVYMCKAINNSGEAVSSTSLKVKSRSSIIGEPLQPDAWQKIQLKEAEMNKVPEMFVDTTPQQAPVFTTHLQSFDKLVEGQHVMLEAQVEPRADPNLRIEWFKNGISLTTGTRLRSTFDFGLVTLAINGLRADDSAIYTCKATNLLGEAVSTCSLKIEDRHWLLGSSLRPEALPIIEGLEAPKSGPAEAPEPAYESPVFITHLNNVECKEGETVHFECHVEPSKDPTLNIEWFVNGKPLPSGARFKSTYDFGYVSLDINHAYAEDSGIYMCKASNEKGQAQTSGTLKCTSKADIYLDTQHPQGQAGLEKVQEAEDAYLSKYQRQLSGPDAAYPKPIFTTPLEPQFSLGETDPLHLECTVEPKEDPNLKVEWYFNGKPLEHASRFKMTCDFGFVTLHLTDVYERDQGIYTCKAYNLAGEAFTSTTIYCTGKASLIEHTQHPKGAEGLEKIQDLEESLRRQEGGLPEGEEGHPPFQNLSNLSEGDIAHFEASLTPVGDQTMVVEWFYKGEVLKASHRTRTVHAFGMVVLEILGTKIEDSGTYTCKATNKWGKAEISVELECSLEGLKDGDSAHFECTLIPVGDPNLKVEWFHNGKPIRHSSRIKSVSDFGYVLMDISYVQSHDSGEYVCRASNRYGEDFTKATIKCAGKGGVYLDSLQPDSLARIRELETAGGQPLTPTTPVLEPPKFITHISDITQLVEGQSAHFEARLTPVNDPNLTVEWFYNGKKLPHGHRYRTFHDFGIVILDILYCYEENSGEYECRAVNKVGQDTTKATLKCVSKANLILDSQLPRGMEGGLEKIQNLEDSLVRTRDERSTETRGQAPVFTVPLSNIDSLREGENAHFEARLTPTDDPKLKVEWFWNGKPLRTGSRFRTFCDFGFVILEISPVYPEDSGEYSCRAFNDYGEAVTTATMKVHGKRSIILESQLPKGMERTIEKIAELEGLGALPGQISPDEDTGKPPEFVTTPADLTLTENTLAHFECQLTPINDSSMRVEWYHNGKPLSAGSRIKTINDFGFVILEVAGVYQRDSGLYTCKATNRHGEATVSCKLQVRGRQGIVMEPQLPTNFRTGTESIQKLEEALYKRDELLAEEEKPEPPKFTLELKDIVDVPEGGPIHFECRVEPIGDSTMRIDWFHNGRPFATGSRVHMLNDFGFIVLDMDYTYARDSGEYVCRATNKWGSATTKATLSCTGNLNFEVQDYIESVGIGEGEPVHFECRVEPKTDPKLRIEWYRNGKLLPSGHRFRTLYDMGFVSLDILYTYPEDSGEYVCRAVNDLGEDKTRATISCKKLPTIILQNQVPKGMKKSEALMQMEATIKKFVTQILDQTSLVEMQSTKFECQLAPVGDPHMKVEWFFNGKPLPHKNRFTPIYDFGYVAMNFGWVYPEDSGEYLCRATNLYGMDETRAIIKTAGKPGIIYESQLPKGMKSIEKIREMEAAWQIVPEEATEDLKPKQAPAFVTKPEPFTVTEGEMARYCCRVTGHPKPRVMWVVNGHTVVNGTRYKLTYDGMWHLDIPKTRQYDNGKVEVIARNSAGEAVAVTDLNVQPRQDDYRNVLKNSPRPWYDYELTQYQKERQETELEKIFEERHAEKQQQQVDIGEHLGKQKIVKEPETEWQQSVKKKKGEEYYSKLKELEDEQVVKETRLREASHQFAIPGEKVIHKSLAKGMAQSYEAQLDKPEETMLSPRLARKQLKHVDHFDAQSETEVTEQTQVSEKTVDTQKVTRGPPPEPLESSIHGKEVHVAKQKQTQKEVRGDLEITRKITATETTEMEHKAKTQERIVQGQVKPAKAPFFTKKIQPCRAFEQGQARFEVEFDGDPLPTIKWFREDFPIQSSPDLQIHTFSTKSILIVRQVFMEDSGVFSVIAENRGGTAKCSANLVVEERRRHGRGGVIPPSFVTTVQDTTVTAGQLARFDARITGTKPLDVYWLKNGKKITSDIRYKTLEEDNTYTLLIIEAFPEDTGKYECVAINSAGEARCDAQCFVQQPASSTPSKSQPSKPATPGTEQAPTIVEPLKGQVIKEGQAVAFRCKISGKPVPEIKWMKGDKVIKPSKYFQMQKEGDIYTLRISEAFPEDEGLYKLFDMIHEGNNVVLLIATTYEEDSGTFTCRATNSAGQVETSAQLIVKRSKYEEKCI
ncbi:Titin, partial [Blattella germanica]